jgi:integrase
MATITERTAKDGTTRYRVEVRLKGYPPQVATFKRKTDAKKWVQDTESAIREGRHFKTAEAKKHTLADLIDRYIKDVIPNKALKMAVTQSQQLAWWRDKIGSYLLSDVTPALIVQCRDELSTSINRRGTQTTSATVVRYMAALSHAFSIAVKEWEWLESSPMMKVQKPKESRGRVRFLDDVERARFLDACKASPNKTLYICVILAISTGMRLTELMTLEWVDVNLKEGFLTLHETKNGSRRRVALSGHGLDLLKEHDKIKRIDTDLLFPSERSPQQPIDLRKAFTNAKTKAGVADFKWHDLRHCTASYLAMNGSTPNVIAEILGHKTLAMVKRYAHLSDSHISSEVASMNAKIFGGLA